MQFNQNEIINLTDHSIVAVTGVDSARFLQGQLTCDIETLQPGQGQLAAHLNPQGRIISLFFLLRNTDSFYFILPKDILDTALGALKKYAVFYKVKLTTETDKAHIGISELTTQKEGYKIPSLNLHLSVNETNAPSSLKAWQPFFIEAGIATIYAKTSGLFLPHDLNLPALGAISFTKGCYTGQEIVARMQYKGKMKKALHAYTFQHTQLPELGQSVFDDKGREAGVIVHAYQSQENKIIALLLLDNRDFINSKLGY